MKQGTIRFLLAGTAMVAMAGAPTSARAQSTQKDAAAPAKPAPNDDPLARIALFRPPLAAQQKGLPFRRDAAEVKKKIEAVYAVQNEALRRMTLEQFWPTFTSDFICWFGDKPTQFSTLAHYYRRNNEEEFASYAARHRRVEIVRIGFEKNRVGVLTRNTLLDFYKPILAYAGVLRSPSEIAKLGVTTTDLYQRDTWILTKAGWRLQQMERLTRGVYSVYSVDGQECRNEDEIMARLVQVIRREMQARTAPPPFP